MISWKSSWLASIEDAIFIFSFFSMVARCKTRGFIYRIPHIYSRTGLTLRDDFVYCFWGIFFYFFFWAFFHRSLAVNVELGNEWPPLGILAFSPFGVPLLNTVILLSSGVRVTWAHHRLISGNHTQTKVSLALTVLLGVYFTILQGAEYYEARFTFADSVYGSTFFLATGFHGIHVIVGTIFLTICLVRLNSFNFRFNHHFGFEAAAWYWHFVDVVWLFLFVRIYWWGGA